MSEIKNVRKILAQDYDEEYREPIGKMAEILNSFMVDVTNTMNGNVDFENLNQQYKVFKITVDASGNATTGNKIRLDRRYNVIGTTCIRARNLTSGDYPQGTPFVSWTVNNYIMTINNITNLQADETYELSIIIYYQR